MPNGTVQFSINLDSPIAVYVQIENQVQFAVASGAMQPGDTLPSVRDMSETLNVNPNTVTKSYRDLELMGYVVTRRGVGVRVADGAPEIAQARVGEMVRAHLRDAVAECLASGMSAAEVRRAVSEYIDDGVAPYQ